MITTHRPIYEIAREIRKYWESPYFGAVPYIRAMSELNTISDKYGLDPAREILNYFLCNASTFRGEHARAIKAEIKSILGRK